MTEPSAASRQAAKKQLHDAIEAADMAPLWLIEEALLTPVPTRLTPYLWKWSVMRQLAERSGELIGFNDGGDRRVIALVHPDLDGLPFATHTLWGAVQYLNPGEVAPPHRHSPGALRFVLEGSGVVTNVNGEHITMSPGDVVLTPSYTWHEHRSEAETPMLWFDGLDVPMVRNLDAIFFEPVMKGELFTSSASEALYSSVGRLPLSVGSPATVAPGTGGHSPLLKYSWNDTSAALNALLKDGDEDSAAIRFVDPTTGRDVMPTLRAEMHRIRAGRSTPASRSVGSSVWVVFSGSGESAVGDQTLSWQAGDMFVTPSWWETQHRASESADLFRLSDGAVIEALHLNRTDAY